MKRTLLILGIMYCGGIILGCLPDSRQWYKSGATKQMYERDKEACDDQLLQTPTTGYQGTMYSFESCMEGKGYVLLDHKAF